MLSSITRNTNKGVRVTVKAVLEDFERKPFGWYRAAILCTLAKLCGRGKIEARTDSETPEGGQLAAVLKNTRLHGNIVLEPQIDIPRPRIRQVKEFHQDFFDRPAKASEAKALGEEVAAGFRQLHSELAALHARSAEYPFLAALAEPAHQIGNLGQKSFKFFFSEFEDQSERLLDQKDALLDPVRRFMAGPQAGLYADIAAFVKQQEANFAHVHDEGVAQLHEILADPQCYRNQGIRQAKSILDRLRQRVDQQIAEERTKAADRLTVLRQRLESLDQYATLPAEIQDEVQTAVDRAIQTLQYQTLIAVIRDTVQRFEEGPYRQLLSRITGYSATAAADTEPTGTKAGSDRPEPQYVSFRTLRVDFDKPWLADADDVAQYLERLRTTLLGELRKGKRIQI